MKIDVGHYWDLKGPPDLPCEQRFLSCMAFSVYEVVRVGCQSRNIKQTNYATDKRGETLRKQ